MAKNQIYIDVVVDDKGTTRKVAVNAKELKKQLSGTSKSAQSTDRALKGTAQASSNTTKNFSKMSQGITGSLVPAYATLAANIFALGAAFRFLREAADFSLLIQAQESYAAATGMALARVTQGLKEASGGMLEFREAAQAAAIGVAKGFSPKQLEDLALGARRASAALGRGFQDAFDRLIRGTSKAEPELLDELGITLRLERATESYGNAIGKARDELTEFERSQAVLLETQRQLNENFGDVEAASNPFIQLSNTFTELIRTITQGVLPVFETLAAVVNRSAVAAAAVFGAIGLSIAKAIVPMDSIKESFAEFSASNSTAFREAKKNLVRYRAELRLTEKNLLQVRAKFREQAAGRAQSILDAGGGGQLLNKTAQGGVLSALERGNLKKALSAAEQQFKKHGEVRTGIFRNADKAMLRSFRSSMNDMDRVHKRWSNRITKRFDVVVKTAKLSFARMRLAFTSAMQAMTAAARVFGLALTAAFKVAAFIGIFTLIKQLLQELKANAFDVLVSISQAVDSIINGFVKAIQWAISTTVGFVTEAILFLPRALAGVLSWVVDQIASLMEEIGERLPDRFGGDMLRNFGDGLRDWGGAPAEAVENVRQTMHGFRDSIEGVEIAQSNLTDAIANSRLGLMALRMQNNTRFMQQLEEQIENVRDSITALNTDLEAQQAGTGRSRVNIIASAGASSIAAQIAEIKKSRPDEAARLLSELRSSLSAVSDRVPQFAEALRSGDLLGSLTQLETKAQAAQGNMTSFENSLETLSDGFRNAAGGDLNSLLVALETSGRLAVDANDSFVALGESTRVFETLNETAGGNFFQMRNHIRSLLETQQNLKLENLEMELVSSRLVDKGELMAQHAERELDLRKRNLAIRELESQLATKLVQIQQANATDTPELEREAEVLRKQIAVKRAQLSDQERRISDLGRLRQTAVDSLQTGTATAFDSIIRGTESVKDAFKNMAVSVLESLSKIISQMLVVKLIESSISLFGGGSVGEGVGVGNAFTQTPGGVNPSTLSQAGGFADGGISRGPKSGHLEMLHGTEAVIPLKNGAVPVKMDGQSGNQINVYVSSDGSTRTEGDGNLSNLGTAIASAVKQELQNQKRSGGMLSPYGVS